MWKIAAFYNFLQYFCLRYENNYYLCGVKKSKRKNDSAFSILVVA